MSTTSHSQESLLLATLLYGEDRKDRAQGSPCFTEFISLFQELMGLQAQGSPVFVELVRLPSYYSTYSGLRLRAYTVLTGGKFYDRSVFSKAAAKREWGKVTGLPLPEETFSEEGGEQS